ncbi:MAG: PAS domain-containing protein [Armatimonadetes bacterium]|nr:PAS domain-containing protein [Armatimonadota bacterium]
MGDCPAPAVLRLCMHTAMNWTGAIYILSLGVSTLASLALAAIAWRRRARPGSRWLCVCGIAVAILAAASAGEPMAATLRGKEFWVNVQYVGYALLPVVYLALALEQTGIHRWRDRRHVVLLLIIPALTVAAAWTNDLHHLMRRDPHPEPVAGLVFLGKTYGPWLWVHAVYSYGLMATGIGILASSVLRTRTPYRSQTTVLLTALVLPVVWHFLYLSRSTLSPRMDLSPAVASISIVLVAIAVLRLGLYEILPVARDLVVEGMRDGMVVVDAPGRLADLNPAGERMLGIKGAVLVGRPLAEALGHLPEVLACITGNVPPEGCDATLEAGEERRFWQIRVSPITDQSGRPVGRVALLHDETEARQAREAQERMAERVVESQRLESLGTLAGGIAHTLNNLLTALMGQAGLAAMRLAPDSPAHFHLDRLQEIAGKAAELSGQMLAYSGKGRFVVVRANVSAIIGQIASLLKAAVPPAAVLHVRLAGDLPPIEADASQIQQAVMNLVTNAAEALPDSGGAIILSTGVQHTDRAYLARTWPNSDLPEGPYVYLRVADTGSGIDPGTLSRIFDPFFSTRFTGRGLGLAAVLGIVRGHRGTIHVQSAPGQGSAFTLLFPPAPEA